jgi:hypothetical protein
MWLLEGASGRVRIAKVLTADSEAVCNLFYHIDILYNRKRRHFVFDYATLQEKQTFPLAA